MEPTLTQRIEDFNKEIKPLLEKYNLKLSAELKHYPNGIVAVPVILQGAKEHSIESTLFPVVPSQELPIKE